MSHDICIWDTSRHPPLPASASEALLIRDRLEQLTDPWNSALSELADRLAASAAPWLGDVRQVAAGCRKAVCRFALPEGECIQQLSDAVSAAAGLGLVVFDDEDGMCFLPDGVILPEDMREVWEWDLQELRDGPANPAQPAPDGRNIWQRIAGELFDAIGRGNRRN